MPINCFDSKHPPQQETRDRHPMTSVTPKRKQELLLEARNARLSWIHGDSYPYAGQQDQRKNTLAQIGNSCSLLESSRVGQLIESAVSIVSMAYDADKMTKSSCDGILNDGETMTAADVANRFRQQV